MCPEGTALSSTYLPSAAPPPRSPLAEHIPFSHLLGTEHLESSLSHRSRPLRTSDRLGFNICSESMSCHLSRCPAGTCLPRNLPPGLVQCSRNRPLCSPPCPSVYSWTCEGPVAPSHPTRSESPCDRGDAPRAGPPHPSDSASHLPCCSASAGDIPGGPPTQSFVLAVCQLEPPSASLLQVFLQRPPFQQQHCNLQHPCTWPCPFVCFRAPEHQHHPTGVCVCASLSLCILPSPSRLTPGLCSARCSSLREHGLLRGRVPPMSDKHKKS